MTSEASSTHEAEVPRLRELQAKYEAVLAEKIKLARDLRVEQSARERYESAYRHVQEEVQRDQEMLRHLYAQIDPNASSSPRSTEVSKDELARRDGLRAKVPFKTASAANVEAASGDGERVRQLERDCAYLQAKVESLHLALRRYEQGDNEHVIAHTEALAASPFSRAAHSDPSPSAHADALRLEQEGRRRAEEQLTRCHATLRSLRDDAAQKEFYFYQQLSALQEQNAALLEDVDMWVTGEQQTFLASTFAPKHGDAKKSEDSAAVPMQRHAFEGATTAVESDANRAQRAEERAQLQEMQQYLKDQEEVLALKDRSIQQLEARVHELEERLACAMEKPVSSPVSLPDISTAVVPLNEIIQLQREAALVEAALQRYAVEYLPDTYVLSLFPPHTISPNLDNAAAVADVMRDLHGVLRCAQEVLTHPPARRSVAPVASAQRERRDAPREPPVTVVQPANTATAPYYSGETLSEAAQQLAKLMRRHVQR